MTPHRRTSRPGRQDSGAASRASRPFRAGLRAALLMLGAAACDDGPGEAEKLEKVQLTRVHEMLLARSDLTTHVAQNPGAPIDVRMMQATFSGVAETLPALVMPPPAEVTIDVSRYPAEAVLRFAVGLDYRSNALDPARGARFVVELDGEVAFDATRHPVPEGTNAERRWQRAEIPLLGKDTLTLRTEETTAPPANAKAILAGFGMLEVLLPFEMHRTRANADHPNAIVILVDTLRADHLDPYGAEGARTPAVGALAARGTLFERAYAPSSFTWPSTATLLTGLAPPEHGVVSKDSNYLVHGIITMAEVFQANGFATGAFSTNPLIAPTKNFDQGFESFAVEPWKHTREILPDVEAWIREHAGMRFFLYLHLTDPHTPYEPDPDLKAEIAGDAPDGWEPSAVLRAAQRLMQNGEAYDAERVGTLRDYDRALYRAEIAGLDRQLERLFGLLDELDLADRTVVALTSDHGEEFLEHGNYAHAKQLYEESIRVPLILAGPGIPRGERVGEPVRLQDVGPTLAAATRLQTPGTFRGPSLIDPDARAELAGEPLYFSLESGWWYDEEGQELEYKERAIHAIQSGDLRLQWGAGDEHERLLRLFDLRADPGEQRNLADRDEKDTERLLRHLEAWLEEAETRQPTAFGADEATNALLRGVGYLGDE